MPLCPHDMMSPAARCILALLLPLSAALGASYGPTEVGGSSPAQPPLRVDHERSSVVAITGKGGVLGFLGHRHAVLATGWSAEIHYDPERPDDTRVDVTIPIQELEIDSPEALRAAGLDPEGGPSDEDLREIRDKMVGAAFLDAEEHPDITFRTVAARRAYGRMVVGGPLSIRGRSRNKNVTLVLEPREDGYRVTGSFTVAMTAFGMQPESVAGVVRVADDVDVRLDIRVTRGSGR